MKKIVLTAESVSKVFNRRVIFDDVSFSVTQTQAVAITGKNGSGKSTLAKIVCAILTPTAGQIACSIDDAHIVPEKIYRHIGLVSPYIMMYEEFSGIENLSVFGRIRNLPERSFEEAESLLKKFGIYERRNDEVRTYSSGMKQRLKYAAALLHHPEILVLDEPTANLDEEGVEVVRDTMRIQKENGILIIATNDKEDLEYADYRVDLAINGKKRGQP
ncbi:MAG TPA: ABC transporter ATP-binding protein [Bacteroidota bacterium]|nr:ABC transporter ATP-binding protein [Bacteroidota bacterium]